MNHAVFSFDENAIWYFDTFGQLFRNGLDGGIAVNFGLSPISPVAEVIWAGGLNDFIILTQVNGINVLRLYNASTKRLSDFPGNMESVGWLSAINKIIYVWRRNDGARELQISNTNTEDFIVVAPLDKFYKVITFLAMVFRKFRGCIRLLLG